MPASYFTDDALLRRVHPREGRGPVRPARAADGWPPIPSPSRGSSLSTGALDDPYERLRGHRRDHGYDRLGARGPRPTGLTGRSSAGCTRARAGSLPAPAGHFPAGTRWAADEREAAAVDHRLAWWSSATGVYDRCIGGLGASQARSLLGRLPRDRPAGRPGRRRHAGDLARLRDLHEGHARLGRTSASSRRWRARSGIEVVLRPPVPLRVRPLVELANFITIGLLPGDVRGQYGFSWDPARALAVRGGAEYVKRVLVPAAARARALRARGAAGGGRRCCGHGSARRRDQHDSAPRCLAARRASDRGALTARLVIDRPCQRRVAVAAWQRARR